VTPHTLPELLANQLQFFLLLEFLLIGSFDGLFGHDSRLIASLNRSYVPHSQESSEIPILRTRISRSDKGPCSGSVTMDFSRCSGSQALPMGQDLLFPQAQPVCSGLTSKEDEGNESILHESTPIKQWAGSSVTLSPSGMDFAEDLLSDVCQFNFDFQTASAEDTANMFPAAYGQDPFRTATPGSASDSTGDGPSSLLDSTEVYDSVAMEPSFSNDSYLDIHNVQYGGMEPKDPHMYDSPAPAKTPFRSANSQELGGLCLAAKQNWPGPDGACFSPEEFKSHPAFYSACQTTWSSPTTSSAEPSLGSSYSQGFQQPYLSSPTSLSAHESITSMEDPISSPFSLGPAQQFHGSDALQSCDALRFVYPYVTPACLTNDSTLRPQHGFQRQSLPCWTPPENIPGPMLAHSGSFLYRRPSSDGENTARRNELYQRSPEDDGLYHCPFAVSEGCMHKPEKLKCNYE
jgi:hypothetical protein